VRAVVEWIEVTFIQELTMKRPLIAGAVVVMALGIAGSAHAQPKYPTVQIPPAPDIHTAFSADPYLPAPADVTGTAQHPVDASPECGPANPQGGIRLPDGNCP
jgi:hypothetical protein